MTPNFVFVERRAGARRVDADPCRHLPLDLCHRKRRKSVDRRTPEERSLQEDREAYLHSALKNWAPVSRSGDSPPCN